jgi:hypothetical protein
MAGSATIYEVHQAIVTDNVDPEQRGRIKVQCSTLVENDQELPDFVDPVFPYLSSSDQQTTNGGWFFVPDIGTIVELEVASDSPRDETPGAISFDAPNIRWRAQILASGADTVGSEFLGDNYPNRRGVQTALGHALVFDDTDNDPEVKLQWSDGQGGFSFLDFDENGSLIILTSTGMMMFMDQENGALTLADTNENLLSMTSDGWYIATTDSDIVKAGGGEVSILTGTLLVNASGANFQVGGLGVQQLGLDTPVIVEGLGLTLTSQLAACLLEVVAIGAGIPGGVPVPAPTCSALSTALSAGTHTATLLTTE